MIELVVFDMAGTTVYDGNAVSDCFRAALAAVGVHPTQEAVNNVMGLHKPDAIRQLLVEADRTIVGGEVHKIHADFVQRMLRFYADDPAVRELPGASAVFAELRRAGVKVALNSGFNRVIVDAIVRRLQWANAIDASVASDEVSRGRPHPDMIRFLMKRVDCTEPSRVAKVGDTPVDLQEGVNVGCGLVIGVTTGSFRREQLAVYQHTHIIDAISEVPVLVRNVQ